MIRVLRMALLAACVPMPLLAQASLADYERAARFQDAGKLVSRLQLTANWINRTDRFWYVDDHDHVKTFMYVDPDANRSAPAFDHGRLAAALSVATGKSYTAQALPFSKYNYEDETERAITFRIEEKSWRCELRGYTCAVLTRPVGAADGEVLSPDGRWVAFLRGYNLWVRDAASGEESPLTRDGQHDNVYGRDVGEPISEMLLEDPIAPEVVFSPDSTRLLTFRADLRQMDKIALIQSVRGRPPVTHTYRYPIAGAAQLSQVRMYVFDLLRKTGSALPVPAFARAARYDTTYCWSEDGTRVAFTEAARGYKALQLHIVDLVGNMASVPVVESSGTYVSRGTQARILGDDLIWSSERDGWNHLYRIDARSGQVHQQLTRGKWVVREIVYVDGHRGLVYFTASGREPGRDPYYNHLYRVKLDGSGLRLLTPESADHKIQFSASGRYFIDTYSRIDAAPVSVLRSASGALVRELQKADLTKLRELGWKEPEPFTAKAADGETDLYGAIYRPSNFDVTRHYPVLDAIYPGPQVIRTPKSFSVAENEQALAELGFIVVTIDGRGTPLRSKAFLDFSYGDMGGGGGLVDHIAGLKQLSARYPQMDLDKVGIYGHSGGGYASTRAVLKFPDFYKVAVSSAGNHDQRSYWAEWGERYHYWPVNDETYATQANASLVKNLKGKLLLVHGDMDDNVHPTGTMQLVDALIAANKDFDLLILPNRNHGFVDLGKGKAASRTMDPYFLRKRWDYFVQHLQGTTPPAQFHLDFKPDK